MARSRLDVVRDCYRAYETGDRALVERHLSAGFRFFSPPDPGIDRERYFERCWPNAELIETFSFVRLTEISDDEVLVTYEATKAGGKRFRNTELLAFDGDQVCRVEVYFGWDLPSARNGS